MEKRFAVIGWTVEDVMNLRPTWTEEKATRLLSWHARRIENAMVEAGWEVIETLIEEEEKKISVED